MTVTPSLEYWAIRIAAYTTVAATSVLAVLSAGSASADTASRYQYNLYGRPGLIDLPSATSAPDADLAFTSSHLRNTSRNTLSFQITPRLSGSFRYANIDGQGDSQGLFDRSFDLHYRFIDEGAIHPAVAIGLTDIVGTGVYASEYLVATKQVTPDLAVTAGLGWGRLGSYRGFENPLSFIEQSLVERDRGFTGNGGLLESRRWFRGDAALFAGAEWWISDDLRVVFEYSSDDYSRETSGGFSSFDVASPYNFGVDYQISDAIALGGYYLYGTELGARLTFTLNPKEPLVVGNTGLRPTPVAAREVDNDRGTGWTDQPDASAIVEANVARLLAYEGMALDAIAITPTSITVLVANPTYIAPSQAIGRAARLLTVAVPASIETFTIALSDQGMATAAVTMSRTDIERLEFAVDQSALMRERVAPVATTSLATLSAPADRYPDTSWWLSPYLATSFFDPDNPVRADFGIELGAEMALSPGLILEGAVRQPLVGTIGEGRESDSVLQRVRSDAPLYAAEGRPALTYLTADYRKRLADDWYGRVTAGYLEPMFGGVSAEVLWKPFANRLGLGAELNYVGQREFDQQFGFQDYTVLTGHVSAYYNLGNGFHTQVDVGRYLAGDLGATLAVDRVFNNGWRIGAFATLTDVPFDDFGEGSFDKGLRFSIPLGHFIGPPTARVEQVTLRPLSRDGGARLDVRNRLYESVARSHEAALSGSWGRFWR